MHRHTISSFASSSSRFWPQLGSRKTSQVSQLYMKGYYCPQHNQRWVTQAVRDRCEPSTLRRDYKTDVLARSCRRRAKPFLLIHSRSEGNQTFLPDPLWKPSRKESTCSVRAVRWTRTRSYSRIPNMVPNSIGSESPPATRRATHREDPKWSSPLMSDIVSYETEEG